MKQNVCKNCKWLRNIPFSYEYECGNENSSYAQCECDPETDTCEEYEEEE